MQKLQFKDLCLFILLWAFSLAGKAQSKEMPEEYISLENIFSNSDALQFQKKENARDSSFYINSKFNVEIKRRNPILGLIPSMYYLSKGNRNYIGEKTCKIIMSNDNGVKVDVINSRGNIATTKEMLSVTKILLNPRIYNETIFGGFILSPFCRKNKSLYRYNASIEGNAVRIAFTPRFRNIQLVSGNATADRCGNVTAIELSGTLDMLKFLVRVAMRSGNPSVLEHNYIETKFSFLGNKINLKDTITYYTDTLYCDSLIIKASGTTSSVINSDYNKKGGDSKAEKDITSYILNRLRGNIGNKVTYGLSPVLNPLYLGYSSYRGITYRIKLQGKFNISSRLNLMGTIRLGYSFKLRQLYINVPVQFNVGKKATIETDFGTGNHISSSEILQQLAHESPDSVKWEELRLDLFKDMFWKFQFKYKLTPCLTFCSGFSYHKRTAVDKTGFSISGKKDKYFSFAPTLHAIFSPWHDSGPVFSYDYERGIKGVAKSDMSFERMEIDASWKAKLGCLRILSTRLGYGMYTSRSKGSYFLDYANFRYNSISGGWDDDWTGEFQLLNRNWYNASKFYARSNLTYESPLLLVSRVPLVGKFIETERIYCNTLITDKLHPYTECGYGFTNRLFSMGMFCGISSRHFAGTGIRMSLELFRDW